MAIVIPTVPGSIPTTNLLPVTPINQVSGSTYTFGTADLQAYTLFTSNSSITATMPANLAPIGTTIQCEQGNTGLLTIVPGTGVSFTPPGNRIAAYQYAVVGLFQKQLNVWTVFGAFA